MDEHAEFRKLCWRSRRGMLELDRLLVPFTEKVYLTLSAEDQSCYQQLLACEDTDLLDWLVNRIPSTNPSINHIVQVVLQYVRTHTL